MTVDSPADIPRVEIGILGGTGLYRMEGLEVDREIEIETPMGSPSDAYTIGKLEGKSVAFLSRHGRGHTLLPSDINYRANICGFKMMGVERILSVNSVGSLKQEIPPRDIVIPDQFFDRSRRRNTFFGEGAVAHVSMADPVCGELAAALGEAGRGLGLRIHTGGTYLCIEGPAFSTRAESNIYRSWGFDVIGMTAATEARLAREAEICYATIALATDYDVWHESEETVSVEMILENMAANIQNAKDLLRATMGRLPERCGEDCGCGRAMRGCLLTRPEKIPVETRERLRPILGKYLEDEGRRS